MAVWLADMDLRLTEVEHFSGKDTCSKMRQLQVLSGNKDRPDLSMQFFLSSG